MIPSVVATQVRNCVCDYLNTTFRPTTPGFEGLMEQAQDISEAAFTLLRAINGGRCIIVI